jgi:hypothetical protein
MTMKTILQNYFHRHRFFPNFLVSVYANRPVVISLCLVFGGLLGSAVFKIVRLILFLVWGPITVPYTESPILLLALVVMGGIVGLFVSPLVAAHRFFKSKAEPIKQNPISIDQPIVVPVATHKFPYKIPDGTNWENVIIQFVDPESIEIRVGKWKHTASYIELDMADKRGKEYRPSEQWHFLKILADLGGEVSFKNGGAQWKLKKQKQALAEKLKSYFSIGYDPFFPYKQYGRYKAHMTLIPLVAPDGRAAVRDIESEETISEDRKVDTEEKKADPISNEVENAMLMENLLDEAEATRYGFQIKHR